MALSGLSYKLHPTTTALLNFSEEAIVVVIRDIEARQWYLAGASASARNLLELNDFQDWDPENIEPVDPIPFHELLEEASASDSGMKLTAKVGRQHFQLHLQSCPEGVLVKATTHQQGLTIDQQRVVLAMDSLYEGLWDWPDVSEEEMWWSDRYYGLLGYEPSALPPTAETIRSLVHPEDRARIRAFVVQHIEEGGSSSCDYRILTKDRGYRWFRARASVMRNEDGSTRVIGTISDIHEQYVMEQELRLTKERLELALDASNDTVWDYYDLNRDRLWLSDHICELLQIPLDQKPRSHDDLFKYIHPDDLDLARNCLEELFASGQDLAFECRLQCGDQWRWVSCVGRVVRDAHGHVSRAIGTISDIHNLKASQLQVEQTNERLEQRVQHRTQELEDVNSALREALKREAASSRELALNERRLRMLTDAVSSIIWTTDKAGNFVEPQPSWQNYTGQSETDAAGKGWHRMIHEDDAEHFLREWKESLSEVKAFASECRIWCNDTRRYRYFAVKALPLLRGEANVLEWVGSMTDVQAQKEHEKQLHNYARELQARNEYLQEFAYAASHDLREPLRKIQAYSNLFNEEFGEELPEEGTIYLENMQRAAGRMEKLIDDLLQYSRASTASFEPEQVDLQEILSEVCEVLEFTIRESEASIEIAELPSVPGQPTLLRQLFQNLISNALKYRRNEVRPQIEVSARTEVEPPEPGGSPKAWHVVSIRDNGIGFDPKHAERIFKPFRRLHTRQQYEGTGIGLAICRRIVERHRGRIEASGKPNAGSTFTIYLPAF